jgi:serine/threonine-protein kinase
VTEDRVADIGSVLGGRYRLLELLGQGGMATIYRARDGQLERDVAVKVLRPEYGHDPDFFARFRQEAQSAASLNHPGVVAVYDYGTDTVGPFIVMELVDGEDLASIIRRSGALPPRQAARLVAQAARAIAAAHESGFVHRDIKPGNILVTREGRVKVADFGIARAIAEAALTLPGTTLGSVHYFSPEQARGETTTPASDIYSLGIVLYELLTGRRPWEGDSAAAVATARLTGPVPSPSAVRAGIPPVLEAIARKAMAIEADRRFASAAAMADALERYQADQAAQGAAASGAADPTAAGSVAAGGAGARAAAAAGAGARAAAAGGTGAAAAAAAAAADDAAGDAAGAPGEPSASAPDAGATQVTAPDLALAGTANPNPGARVPYPPEAYAGAEQASRPLPVGAGRRAPDVSDGLLPEADERSGTSPWLWVSGLLAIAILALAAFLVFRLLSADTTSPPSQVEVPNFVGMRYQQAQAAADDAGLVVARSAFEPSDLPDGTVLAQTPRSGAAVDPGTTIELTLALGDQTVAVPDLRAKSESEALNLIAGSKLSIGTRTEAFDAFIPAGAVVSQDPGPGVVVTQGLAVNYVVSKGPEPTPTPSPSPSPSPSPTLETPPVPTEPPAATPTPAPLNVGDYRCLTLADASTAMLADGFTVGSTDGDLAGKVVAQAPGPGAKVAFGTPINVTFENPPVSFSCP